MVCDPLKAVEGAHVVVTDTWIRLDCRSLFLKPLFFCQNCIIEFAPHRGHGENFTPPHFLSRTPHTHSMGQEEEAKKRMADFEGYQVRYGLSRRLSGGRGGGLGC
jgi:hypothetical protein